MAVTVLFALGVIVFLRCFRIYLVYNNPNYYAHAKPIIKSFEETVGIEDIVYSDLKYSDLLGLFGEPESVEIKSHYDDMEMLVHYPGITFGFVPCIDHEDAIYENRYSEEWNNYMIEFSDPKYDFGRGIHVGCSKRHILMVCPKRLKVAEAEAGTEYWNWMYHSIISFKYDTNNRVTHIKYSLW